MLLRLAILTLMISRKRVFGWGGELLAAAFLMMRGYMPVAWGYHHPAAEIDLVCRRGKVLLLVEVKTRKNWQAHKNALGYHQNQRQIQVQMRLQQKYPAHTVQRALVSIAPQWPFLRLTFM